MEPPAFSVVVPCRARTEEERDNLRRCLAALAAASPPPLEVVLVDDGSDPPLEAPVWSGPPLRLVRQRNAGPAAARNRGASEALGNCFVFVDADIVVPADTFARLRESFAAHPDAQAVWGTVTAAHPHAGLVSRYKNHTHRHFTQQQAPATNHLTTMLAAIRREAFEAVGGFDTRLRTVSVEDVELGRDLHAQGALVLLDQGLEAEHRHRFTLLRALRNDFHKARRHARTTLDRRARGDSSVGWSGPGERRQLHYLMGVPLGAGAVVALLAGRWRTSGVLFAALAAWERELLGYLSREEGPGFALACLPLLALERTTVAAAVAAGAVDHLGGRLRGESSLRALPGRARPALAGADRATADGPTSASSTPTGSPQRPPSR